VKHLKHTIWTQGLLAAAILAFSTASYAQKIKVRKVKGNQAIVEFSGGSLQNGQVYELAPDEFAETGLSSDSRKYVVALSFSMLNTKSDAAGSANRTEIDLSAKFGWNFGSYEFGPMISYSSQEETIKTTAMKFGAFGDFNMISNAPGEAFIYGLGGTGTFGQYDTSGAKRDLMDFFVGPFVKWFPTGGNTGLRIDVGYTYQKQSGGTGSDVTISGLAVAAGLTSYF